VWWRDCSWCAQDDYSGTLTRLGPGLFQARLTLYANATTREYRHQLVFRFALAGAIPVGAYRVRSYTEATPQHLAANSNRGTICIYDWAGNIIITHRSRLYFTYPDDAAVLRLLQTVYDMASTSMVVYYADDYNDLVRRWNAYDVPYWTGTNIVADIVDNLIEDWVDDSHPRAYYVAIIGDDQMIPYYRLDDPLDSESEHACGRDVHPILFNLTNSDGFFSDAKYADLDDDDWSHRPTDLAVGRIVGASPQDMQTFITSGIVGVDVSSRHFVGASWADSNFDHEYDVQDAIRDAGFDILYDGTGESYDMIDDLGAVLSLPVIVSSR